MTCPASLAPSAILCPASFVSSLMVAPTSAARTGNDAKQLRTSTAAAAAGMDDETFMRWALLLKQANYCVYLIDLVNGIKAAGLPDALVYAASRRTRRRNHAPNTSEHP